MPFVPPAAEEVNAIIGAATLRKVSSQYKVCVCLLAYNARKRKLIASILKLTCHSSAMRSEVSLIFVALSFSVTKLN